MKMVPSGLDSCPPELVLARLLGVVRERRGLSQHDLARAWGLSQSAIASWERNRAGITVSMLDLWTSTLGLSGTALYDLYKAALEDLAATGCRVEPPRLRGTRGHSPPRGVRRTPASRTEVRLLDTWLDYWVFASAFARETLGPSVRISRQRRGRR